MNDSSIRGFKALQDELESKGIVGVLLFFGSRGILDVTMRYNQTGIQLTYALSSLLLPERT